MDADEILTGKKQECPQERPLDDAFFWHRNKTLSKKELESFRSQGISIPTLNPKPIVKICDAPHTKENKRGKGILLGMKWSF